MKTIEVCPSTLRPGFSTYSPQAVKELFDGLVVSPFIDIDFENERDQQQAMENMNNMSISGAQEKFSAIIDDGKIRLTHKGEQATYILKPAPFNLSLSTRKQIPANEHLTMQIASQVYGIRTASNGLCFSSSGQPVYITKRFDVINGVKESSQEDRGCPHEELFFDKQKRRVFPGSCIRSYQHLHSYPKWQRPGTDGRAFA